jgi:Mn2+/Fe2+ NRAMP family transporter
VEEGWSSRDLAVERVNVFIGFPVGAILAMALMVLGAVVLAPRGITVSHLSQVGLPVTLSLGRSGLWLLLIGMFAAVFGAAAEATLSSAYSVCQYFGWQWGKFVRRPEAPRFWFFVVLFIIVAALVGLIFDPIKIALLSLVFSAAAVPLTFFPILIVANDPAYVGDKTNGRVTNVLSVVLLALMVIVTLATVPLLIVTRGNA